MTKIWIVLEHCFGGSSALAAYTDQASAAKAAEASQNGYGTESVYFEAVETEFNPAAIPQSDFDKEIKHSRARRNLPAPEQERRER